jgi:hypothetical protein
VQVLDLEDRSTVRAARSLGPHGLEPPVPTFGTAATSSRV